MLGKFTGQDQSDTVKDCQKLRKVFESEGRDLRGLDFPR